jgi:hypothetical protein
MAYTNSTTVNTLRKVNLSIDAPTFDPSNTFGRKLINTRLNIDAPAFNSSNEIKNNISNIYYNSKELDNRIAMLEKRLDWYITMLENECLIGDLRKDIENRLNSTKNELISLLENKIDKLQTEVDIIKNGEFDYMIEIAKGYQFGRGVEKNLEMAHNWYLNASFKNPKKADLLINNLKRII